VFSQRFFAYCDDMEYSLRAQNAGFGCVVVPNAKLYHKSHMIDLGGKSKLPLHYFFFNSRNGCWAWMPLIPKFRRVDVWRKYIAELIRKVAYYKVVNCEEAIDPTLDGLWCGIRGKGGPWDKEIHMPESLKKLMLWKPYWWADILEGNFGKLFRGFLLKLAGCKKSEDIGSVE
jgi:hypothetical protein